MILRPKLHVEAGGIQSRHHGKQSEIRLNRHAGGLRKSTNKKAANEAQYSTNPQKHTGNHTLHLGTISGPHSMPLLTPVFRSTSTSEVFALWRSRAELYFCPSTRRHIDALCSTVLRTPVA